MNFKDLELHPLILKALDYDEPTKIQLKAIPKIMKGFDIRGSAQTGTGKTAAFLLPALNKLLSPAKESAKGPRILILAPTRELAMQITDQANKYSKHLKRAKTVCVCGGMPLPPQLRKLSKPYDILVATPGRLIDFINRKKVNFARLEMLVLDEADRMLDMGFLEPVEEIVSKTPADRQTLLFSATFDGNVAKLSDRLLTNPMEIVVHAKKEKHENIEQKLHFADNIGHKNRLLNYILREDELEYAIIFTSTKRHAAKLVGELHENGFPAAALHGDMSQRQRTRAIGQLKDGTIRIMVATDVAARGIDVSTITHVINFDLPRNIEDYVHRIGRTGRAGAKGTAISFASNQEGGLVRQIEGFTGQKIAVTEIEGLEPRNKPQFSDKPNNKKKRPNKPFKKRSNWRKRPPRSKAKR
ncbi:MAG: DEAD/DEAH box helicase [Simkaniaceae bacterium]|nr:DEAD/DEAH box helicase [Simkaniaceae bacterium]